MADPTPPMMGRGIVGNPAQSERSSQVNKNKDFMVVEAFTNAVHEADAAGEEAASKCTQQMLTIKGYEHEPFPICGFAWVNFKPATTRFVRFLKKEGLVNKAYEGGANLWVSKYGQSYDKKLAYARAFADSIQQTIVLSGLEPSLSVHGAGRLD